MVTGRGGKRLWAASRLPAHKPHCILTALGDNVYGESER